MASDPRWCFLVRDESEKAVMKALASPLLDPAATYLPEKQDLMFFAAARKLLLGGAAEVAGRLRELGVPGDSQDRYQQTPLFYAAREGNILCAELLVEQRCDVNHRDINGQSALFFAARENHADMCRLLLGLGASCDLKDKNEHTPRNYARGVNGVSDVEAIFATVISQEPVAGDASKTTVIVHPDPSGLKATGTGRKRRRLTGPTPPELATSAEDAAAAAAAAEAMAAWVAGAKRAQASPSGSKWAAARSAGTLAENWPDGVDIFSESGEYCICAPAPGDVERLRELEREFVHDHLELFSSERWHKELGPADWCDLVNVIFEEEKAKQAIHNIVIGKTYSSGSHITLQCVYAGSDSKPPRIVGYAHVVYKSGRLDISHLKVERVFQRRGLGQLLLAGSMRKAMQAGWTLSDLELVVVSRNEPALALYRTLGFQEASMHTKTVPLGSGRVDWQKMKRPLRGAAAEATARQYEERSRGASSAS
mmetsp:Transcript_37944/g.100368  ORF Transcript_37944/g.100368 Transcript_37944/m.100368 type:complete len:482 (-) Transcript_37944:8-1453(-)